MDDLAMSDLQSTDFNGLPDLSDQEADASQKNMHDPTTPSPSSGVDIHCTDDEYRDIFEPDTAYPSIEPPTPTTVKDENAETFANNGAAYELSNEASADLLMPILAGSLKNESVDPALFSTEDMDAIFGKATVFDDNFKLDDAYKLETSSLPPWTSDGKPTNNLTLASPFKPEDKLDYSYMTAMQGTSDANLEPHHSLPHAQSNIQAHAARQVRQPQDMCPDYAHVSMAEDPQMAVYRFPDGRRRSHTVPPEIRVGMGPPANMGHPHLPPHQHRQQQTPQPQFHRVIAEHRHHPMTPPPPHLRQHAPVHGFGRGQPVFHRQMEPRGRALSPEPKRKRQKVGHLVEAPVRDPVSHLFESMMGNVEFVVRQGLAGIKFRMNDDFERSVDPLVFRCGIFLVRGFQC